MNYYTMRNIFLNYSSGVFSMQLMELPELNLIASRKNPQLKGLFFYNASIHFCQEISPKSR